MSRFMPRALTASTLVIGLALALPAATIVVTPANAQQQIYGSQLMTEQERNEYRNRMQNAKTEQERAQIRMEHHQRMQDRARQRGVTLPAEPPAKGGMGMGQGMGQGQGQGMGTGKGETMPMPGMGKGGKGKGG